MTAFDAQEMVEELMHLYSTWKPHASEVEMWSRMLSRFELPVRDAVGVLRGYRETLGDRQTPKISEVRRIVAGAALRHSRKDRPVGSGHDRPCLAFTIQDRESSGRGFPFWWPRLDLMPARQDLERHAFRALEKVEQTYGPKQWVIVWPGESEIQAGNFVCTANDEIPF